MYDGSKAIEAIILNGGLYGYVKCVIDDTSLLFLKGFIQTIKVRCSLEDQMAITLYLKQMVTDAKLTLN